MEWLNYHHLLYFWTAAKEGGIVPAAKVLNLSHPTISGQIRQLEEFLGEKLFQKKGRGLVLTETGHVVYRYADEIFGLGSELLDTVRGRHTGRPIRLRVGITDVLPKLVVRRLLEPAFRVPEPIRVECREDQFDRLLAELASHTLDVVLFSDTPVPPGASFKVFNHPLGECGITFFAAPSLKKKLKGRFPKSLDGAPILLPSEMSALRRPLERWFEENDVRPVIVAECDDSALLKAFGQDGIGVFPAPSAVEASVCRQHEVKVLGHAEGVRERFYAISAERRLQNPAVVQICNAARLDFLA